MDSPLERWLHNKPMSLAQTPLKQYLLGTAHGAQVEK